LDFENRSEVEAALLRGDLPKNGRTQAVVVAKACGVFDVQGRMTLDFGIKVPVCFQPEPHPFGQVPADLAIVKQGLDVIALGKAYHPRIAGGGQSRVTARVGGDERQLAIFGERLWYRSLDGHWRISEPQDFSLLELTWEHSFGGVSFDAYRDDNMHPLNKDGKGFVASEEAIEDTALPNIEDPSQLITSWQDQPRPCNIAPAPKHIAFDPMPYVAEIQNAAQTPFRVPDSLWNDAVTKFRFEGVQPGAEVTLSGMSEVPLALHLPTFQLQARVALGNNESTVPLRLDTLLFFPEARRCTFSWRASFTYDFVPKQQRRVTLEKR